MNRLKGRVKNLEKRIRAKRKMPITIKPIYLGDDNWPKQESMVKEKYFAEHGTLDGLKIVRHWIPEPAPLPAVYRRPPRDDIQKHKFHHESSNKSR